MIIYLNFKLVSIAPLWNWKAQQSDNNDTQSGFNRTFMELKDPTDAEVKDKAACFNRTFMELKG